MKYSLFSTLLALGTMALMVLNVRSSGLRGLQSVSEENPSPNAPSIKISGLSTLLQILNSAPEFMNAPFDVLTIDSFGQKVTDQGLVIEGKVTLANDQGVNIAGIISGSWDSVNNKIVFTATKYEVETEVGEQADPVDAGNSTQNATNPDVPADYTAVDIEVAKNDSNISTAFNWGAQALIRAGERQNKIPTSNYTVTEWSSAAYKNKSNGIYYKFVAELLGENEVHVETNITVFYWYSNQSYLLAGYYYKATNIPQGSLPNNFTEIDNSNNNTNSTDATNSTDVSNNSTDINNNSTDINNNSTDITNNSTDISNNGTNSTNTTLTPPYVPENYTYISPADLANNSQAQAALTWGVDAIVQKAISQYKLPAASPQYNVTNLILSAYKNTSSGINYIFWMNLTNALKYKVDTNITVAYRASNQTYRLTGYAFRTYNYPSGAIVIPQNNSTNSTNNSTNNATNSTNDNTNSTIGGNNNTDINANSTNNATSNITNPSNVTVPNNSTNGNSTTNVTAPTNSTTNNTTPDGYTILTAAQFANDSLAQAALQSGISSLIQKGISQNKIPAAHPNYTVLSLIQASYKKQVIGTSYKFQANLTNPDYYRVDANMTVFYRYSTKTNSLNGYAYRSYNYSASALGDNNVADPPVPPQGDPILIDNAGGDIPIIIEEGDASGAR